MVQSRRVTSPVGVTKDRLVQLAGRTKNDARSESALALFDLIETDVAV